MLSRSRVLCLCQSSGSISFGHQFFGGSIRNQPAMTMPTVMMMPWRMMKFLTCDGVKVAEAPAPEVNPPMAMMNGTDP